MRLRVLQSVTLAAVLERVSLQDDRHRLRREHRADEREEEFGFEENRDRA